MRKFQMVVTAIAMTHAGTMVSTAQTAEPAREAEVVELFERLCVETNADFVEIARRLDDSWVRLPLQRANDFYGGIVPAERNALIRDDLGPAMYLLLSAQGQITSEHNKLRKTGLLSVSNRVDPDHVVRYPIDLEGPDRIGSRECQLATAAKLDIELLLDLIAGLEIDGRSLGKHNVQYESQGEYRDAGLSGNHFNWIRNNTSVMRLSRRQNHDGKWYVELSVGSAVAPDDPPETYELDRALRSGGAE